MRYSLLVPASSEDIVGPAVFEHTGSITVDLTRSTATPDETRRHAHALLMRARRIAPQMRLFAQISELSTGLADADLAAVLAAAPDGIVLSGCKSGEDVQHLGTKLAVHEAELGIADGATRIIAVGACDAQALFRMGSYEGASPRLAGLTWDAERLAAALRLGDGGSTDQLPSPLALGRTLTIVAARAAGVPAFDTVCRRNGDALATACREARRDGFAAKFAVHLDQLPVIEAAFAMSDEV